METSALMAASMLVKIQKRLFEKGFVNVKIVDSKYFKMKTRSNDGNSYCLKVIIQCMMQMQYP